MRDQLQHHINGELRYLSNTTGSIVLIRSSFAPFRGVIQPASHTKFGLNIGTTSWAYRHSDLGRLDTVWRRNGLTLSLPNDTGLADFGAVTMIGLAVDFNAIEGSRDGSRLSSLLEPLATSVTVDVVSARLVRSLFNNAELHGCSDAFFDAGLDALTLRLSHGLNHARDRKPAPLDNHQLSTVRDLIAVNLSTGLSVEKMATALCMDRTHFAKRFRNATGMAPFAYLTKIRMEHALTMLRRGDRVIDVATAVGYSNPSKFAAAFKRHTGLSPRAWLAGVGGN